ncbi:MULTISPECIES: UDP-2,3-diacylglucosamine diphosphatase LpxI [unclassified Roseitalea]|uniref:LpxI family protein n=1 Tax=unclassified Roseitalea TaxID=2639107 RepID=UPI00273DBA70|nr:MULTISPECIES: UDP-2,3-diacylglucosamine diphosphatase LpxI [unclassified Roseitalea]
MQDINAPIGIIAGGGAIPLHIAELLAERRAQFVVIMLDGNADERLAAFEHGRFGLGQPGPIVRHLRDRGVRTVVLVGSVSGRPDIGQLRPDLTTLRFLRHYLAGRGRGDDALLRMVVGILQSEGFAVAGVHELEPDLLAPVGPLGRRPVAKGEATALEVGARAAHALGAIDAGQAVVVIGRRVVALEGAEGTDAMLERVADLRGAGRLSNRKGGVLVKLRKPGQDMRVDLPTIGVGTVQRAAAARLAGIAVHGENTLIVDRQATIEAADAAGLFLIGLDPNGLDGPPAWQ